MKRLICTRKRNKVVKKFTDSVMGGKTGLPKAGTKGASQQASGVKIEDRDWRGEAPEGSKNGMITYERKKEESKPHVSTEEGGKRYWSRGAAQSAGCTWKGGKKRMKKRSICRKGDHRRVQRAGMVDTKGTKKSKNQQINRTHRASR